MSWVGRDQGRANRSPVERSGGAWRRLLRHSGWVSGRSQFRRDGGCWFFRSPAQWFAGGGSTVRVRWGAGPVRPATGSELARVGRFPAVSVGTGGVSRDPLHPLPPVVWLVRAGAGARSGTGSGWSGEHSGAGRSPTRSRHPLRLHQGTGGNTRQGARSAVSARHRHRAAIGDQLMDFIKSWCI